MEEFLKLLEQSGSRTAAAAVLICVLTALLKLPVKKFADSRPDRTKITRFVTFLPVILGFGAACLDSWLKSRAVVFDGALFTFWISSSSLSLAIYAFLEKFIPSKNKILSEAELKENLELLEKLREKTVKEKESDDEPAQTGGPAEEELPPEAPAEELKQEHKWILGGNRHDEDGKA